MFLILASKTSFSSLRNYSIYSLTDDYLVPGGEDPRSLLYEHDYIFNNCYIANFEDNFSYIEIFFCKIL